MDRHEIQSPDVIITGYDKQMKVALDSQYPGSQQQVCIHHINSNVLLNAKRRWKDKKEEDDDNGFSGSDNGQLQVALTSTDKAAVLDIGKHGGPLSAQANRMSPVSHNYRGVLELWKYVVFAETKEDYEKAWVRLCEEFNDQQAILIYLYNTYLPIASQWAHCFIKKYRNFGSSDFWHGGKQQQRQELPAKWHKPPVRAC